MTLFDVFMMLVFHFTAWQIYFDWCREERRRRLAWDDQLR